MRFPPASRHLSQGSVNWRGLVSLLACILVVAIGIAAGLWQTERARFKLGIEARIQERSTQPPLTAMPELLHGRDLASIKSLTTLLNPVEFRHLRLKGRFNPDWPVFLENRPYQSKVGFYVLMPFLVTGTDQYILVARGWLARDKQDRSKIPKIFTPTDEVEIEGVIRQHPGRLMQLGSSPTIQPQAILQNLTVEEFALASKLPMQPYLLEQLDLPQQSAGAQAARPLGDGLIRDWPRASSGVDKHRGYAFQWFGLAAAAFFFYVFTGIRRVRHRKQEQQSKA